MPKKKNKKKQAMADATVFIVAKSALKNNKIVAEKQKWVAIDGHPHHKGNKIEWQILDKQDHKLEIETPSIVNHDTLRIKGNRGSANIYSGAKPGYYEYYIYVDGEFVEGGSAPGIIIE